MTTLRERHAEKKQARALEAWRRERDEASELLHIAEDFQGEDTSDLLLGKDEKLFLRVTNSSLIEERRGQGHYEGRSSGLSIPIGSIGGRSIRYRVGSSRGHYVQGVPTPTPIRHRGLRRAARALPTRQGQVPACMRRIASR